MTLAEGKFEFTELLKRWIAGLKLEWINASQIKIHPGECISDDGQEFMGLLSDETVDITVLGVGGRDAGVEAANTWYHIWLIKRPEETELIDNVRGLISTSSIAPILPAGFTKKRRIGSVRNNVSSNFLEFTQFGTGSMRKMRYWSSQNVLAWGAAVAWTNVDCSMYVPPTSIYVEVPLVGWDGLGGNFDIQLRTDGRTPANPLWLIGYNQASLTFDMELSPAQIMEYKVNPATARTFGYIKEYLEEI